VVWALQAIDIENVLKIATNTGTATAWIGAIRPLPSMPPPVGTAVWFKPGIGSAPGGTTFALNGFTAPVTLPDLSQVRYGDITATAWLLLFYDGTEWLVLVGSGRPPGGISYLRNNITWYVNGSIGSDTLYDGTVDGVNTPISGTHGPFATIQRAVTETKNYNLNGFDQFIRVADGSYTGPVSLGITNGTGLIQIIGNTTTPANCKISTTPSPYQSTAIGQNAGNYYVTGFRVSTSPGPSNGDPADGISVNTGNLAIDNIQFGPCVRAHICSAFNSKLAIGNSPITIEAAGNASQHLLADFSTTINVSNVTAYLPTLNILGAVTFGQFVNVGVNSSVQVTYAAINGAANVTGQKYYAWSNGVIAQGGNVNYYPGNSAGATTSGGQYV
jgi:hypothetical protein